MANKAILQAGYQSKWGMLHLSNDMTIEDITAQWLTGLVLAPFLTMNSKRSIQLFTMKTNNKYERCIELL